MRPLFLSLLFVFLATSALSATDPAPGDAPAARVVPSLAADPGPGLSAGMHLDRIAVEERAASDDAVAAQLGPRGGFWWLVGVVVVAGVILAVLL